MIDNNCDSRRVMPIEKHDTAAWANVEEVKPDSNVTIPSETQMENAKDYVDTNQK